MEGRMDVDFGNAAPNIWQARGMASHSDRKQPQSRSFSLTIDSTMEGAMLRTLRHRASTFSSTAGLRLCGMVEEPTLPMKNGSSNSRISVCCREKISWLIRPIVPAQIASVLTNSAWLSRATCQAIVGTFKPRISIMRFCVSSPFSG